MSSFTFKQFAIEQDHCAMKVGTDGVLLGAWCDVAHARHALDIGTGTGLLALMVAQRNPTIHVDAVEIDPDAAQQATENVANAPFANRINVYCADIQAFASTCEQHYDAIVCNPPYFTESLKCPDAARRLARHTDTLPFAVVLNTARQLLTEHGCLSVVLPTEEAKHFTKLAAEHHFSLTRLTHVRPTPTSTEKRRLMEFCKKSTECTENELVIELSRHIYSDDYKTLTKNFYLKF